MTVIKLNCEVDDNDDDDVDGTSSARETQKIESKRSIKHFSIDDI